MKKGIAVDIGNFYLVAAECSDNGIKIIQSSSAQRLIPAIILLSSQRLLVGDRAKELSIQHPQETVSNLKTLIGLPYRSELRSSIEKSSQFVLGPIQNGLTSVEIQYDNVFTQIHIEQYIAFILRSVAIHAEITNFDFTNLFFVTEPWWGQVQRQIILNACNIAGIRISQMVNSTTAAAINYACDFPKIIPNNTHQKTICAFVDFGDSSVTFSLIEYTQKRISVIAHVSDETLGGSSFTDEFVKLLCLKTIEKYKFDPSKYERSMRRFRDEAEKVKKSLSINTSMKFECQSINDRDISFIISRNEFEKCCEKLISNLEIPINELLSYGQPEFVEICGGAARPPFIRAKLEQLFKCDVRQTMNPDECNAMGAVRLYKKHINIFDVISQPFLMQYKNKMNTLSTETIFKVNSPFPYTEKKTITTSSNINIICGSSIFATIHLTNKKDTIQITFNLDSYGMLHVASITKEGSKQSVDYHYIDRYEISEQEIINMQNFQKEVEEREEDSEKAEQLRGQLEVDLMHSENEEAKLWFEQNEFNLLPSEEYQNWINILKNKTSSKQQTTILNKNSKQYYNHPYSNNNENNKLTSNDSPVQIKPQLSTVELLKRCNNLLDKIYDMHSKEALMVANDAIDIIQLISTPGKDVDLLDIQRRLNVLESKIAVL